MHGGNRSGKRSLRKRITVIRIAFWRSLFLVFGCALSIKSAASAREQMPWFNKNLELELRSSYLFQTYPSIQSSKNSRHYSSDDSFLTFGVETSVPSLALTYFGLPDVIGAIDGELEIVLAGTHHRHFGFDSARATLRNQWMDDVVGDPVSLATGLTGIQACQESLHDPSSFHHGKLEGEIHLSLGIEAGCYSTWTSRCWGFFALGSADVGSPWIRGDLAWEHLSDGQRTQIRVFTNTCWGLGGRSFKLQKFHGYGPIAHQSIDIGLRYSYDFDIWGVLALEYTYRPYARNFPQYTNRFSINYTFPYGF